MIEFFDFQRDGYKLVIVEVSGFQPINLNSMLYPDPQYPKIRTQGVAISVLTDRKKAIDSEAVLSTLTAQYKNVCKWLGVVDWTSHTIVVTVSFDRSRAVGQILEVNLPCLQCHREGVVTILDRKARSPYCSKHTDDNPARKKSRHRKA